MRSIKGPFAAILVAISLTSATVAIGQESVIHTFGPYSGPDGSTPNAGMLLDAKGDLIGTTYYGGEANAGTVFMMSPGPGGGWTEKVIYSFKGVPDGACPNGPLISDAEGNLYGTTTFGGSGNGAPGEEADGTVFKLSPTQDGGWTETVIYRFQGLPDGLYPVSRLTFDAHGNLYGTTKLGGLSVYSPPNLYTSYGLYTQGGTVFELTPATGGEWTEKVLYRFDPTVAVGGLPLGGVVIAPSGKLYVASSGNYGPSEQPDPPRFGGVVELSPQNDGSWVESIVHEFSQTPGEGVYPQDLTQDEAGNLYGTTISGGTRNGGTVYELSPVTSGTWTEKILLDLQNVSSDYYFYYSTAAAATPQTTLLIDSQGNLFGTTFFGGIPLGDSYSGGTVFEVSPAVDGTWTETVLHRFYYTRPDGAFPVGGVVLDSSGNLYGTTTGGGTQNHGTVFEIAPTAKTTTTLMVNPSTNLVVGEPLTLTATVTSTEGAPTPTGTVDFTDPGVVNAVVQLTVGVAIYKVRAPAAGTYTGFASYNGDAAYSGSSSASITRTVAAPPPQ